MGREAADIARRAAEIIQERGMCKGAVSDADGRVCLWGALLEAAQERGLGWYGDRGVQPLLAEAIRPLNLDNMSQFDGLLYGAAWNDRPETDERDVAKVLLQVADRLEIGGAA